MSEELTGALLRYELFSEINEVGCTVYGIGIESGMTYDNGSASVSDITENVSLAIELFERVIAHTVTPCELLYVAEDFICEKYSV